MNEIVFGKPNEFHDLKGLKIAAFDPSYLHPLDNIYNAYGRECLRRMFVNCDPEELINHLPAVITVPDPSDGEIFVLDGNHRTEAADYACSPIVGIHIENQHALDCALQAAVYDQWIRSSMETLIHNKRADMDLIWNHVRVSRSVLESSGIYTFEDYRKKALSV